MEKNQRSVDKTAETQDAMHLTNGKILNSIVLWMNYAISLKP